MVQNIATVMNETLATEIHFLDHGLRFQKNYSTNIYRYYIVFNIYRYYIVFKVLAH